MAQPHALDQILLALLLDLDVEQAQRVKAVRLVQLQFVIVRVGPPLLGPKRNRNGRSERVQLQAWESSRSAQVVKCGENGWCARGLFVGKFAS